ncbi:S1C family serine protease [Austwickia chelonae]|uniref:S1C family serine protease n=1 Tax=Austwickia chelonae TaxID=100225 RepID=UPI0003141A71|nr:trypsin-like peptidase domain-containing protein [Austwickia chelonae]
MPPSQATVPGQVLTPPGAPQQVEASAPPPPPAGQDVAVPAAEAGSENTTWATGDGHRQAYPPPAGWTGQQPPPGQPWPAGPGQSPPPAPGASQQKARRLLEIGVAATLAAVLASGGTWALFRSSAGTSRMGEPARQVEQADPNNPNWTATAKAVTSSVVSIQVSSGSRSGDGSGVIIDNKGHVVTNNHVVMAGGESAKITVALDDKRVYSADIVGTDPATDLAVLRINDAPKDLHPIILGDDTKLRVGDPVMAVGNPLGLAGTVTTGIVSALNRPVTTRDKAAPGAPNAVPVVTNAIQTSAAINPGNSGGALVNGAGQLVGINSSIASLSQTSGNIGIGFAIPANEAKSVAEQLINHGKARHAFLGVTLADEVVPDGNDQRAAAKIQQVSAGSAAEKASIRAGDAVVAVDSEVVDGRLSLQAQIRERKAGDQVTLTIVREGKRQDIRVTLDEDTRN